MKIKYNNKNNKNKRFLLFTPTTQHLMLCDGCIIDPWM